MKVLLVEDKSALLLDLEDICREAGHEVLTAGSGREAMDILGEGISIDAVITDVQMPRGSGIELLQFMRRLYGSSAPPTLVRSSENDFNSLYLPDHIPEYFPFARFARKGGARDDIGEFLRTAASQRNS